MNQWPNQPDGIHRRTLTRRGFLLSAAAATAWVATRHAAAATDPATAPSAAGQRYRISVCDIMLLKRQKLGAIKLAKEIGVDGVEVDMGGLGNRPQFENLLADATVREQFESGAHAAGIAFSSLAMTAYYAQSFADHPGADRTVEQWIETATAMKIKVGFLPLGVKGDLSNAEIRTRIVTRLKHWGPQIEKAGLVLGLEANTDADGYNKLLDDIGSPAVQVYFNFQSPLKAGLDLGSELRKLGKARLCQIHCTDDDGHWLQDNPRLDMKQVKGVLDEIGFDGWLTLERSRVAGKSVKENFGTNAAYMKSIFQA